MGRAYYGGPDGPHQYTGGLLPGWVQAAILVVLLLTPFVAAFALVQLA